MSGWLAYILPGANVSFLYLVTSTPQKLWSPVGGISYPNPASKQLPLAEAATHPVYRFPSPNAVQDRQLLSLFMSLTRHACPVCLCSGGSFHAFSFLPSLRNPKQSSELFAHDTTGPGGPRSLSQVASSSFQPPGWTHSFSTEAALTERRTHTLLLCV